MSNLFELFQGLITCLAAIIHGHRIIGFKQKLRQILRIFLGVYCIDWEVRPCIQNVLEHAQPSAALGSLHAKLIAS